jgi:cytochrome c oxidase subunit 2
MSGFVLWATGATPTQNVSIFDPASPPAESIRDLSFLIFAITGFIFLVVEGVLLYCIFRFRRRPFPSPSPVPPGGEETGTRGAGEPPQVYGSKPIEIAWTAAPTLIVFIIVLVTTRTLWEVDVDLPRPEPGDNRLFVTVIGRQWWWEYRYEYYNGRKLNFITANELHIPASEPKKPHTVYLILKSGDVCHSYWVPRLAGKTDLIPGRTNRMWFQTDRAGEIFVGQCAEYCGTQHANMLLRVYVDSADDFKKWLENQKKDQRPKKSDPKEVKLGRDAFLGQSCVNCHRVRGTPAQGRNGFPDLTHLMSRRTIAGGMIENNEKNLRRWVRNPQKIKPGCLMAPFDLLGDKDINRIVRYLLTLK